MMRPTSNLCTQSERFQGYAPKKYFRSLPHPAEQAAVAAVLLVGLLHKLCSTLPQTAQRLDGRHPLHKLVALVGGDVLEPLPTHCGGDAGPAVHARSHDGLELEGDAVPGNQVHQLGVVALVDGGVVHATWSVVDAHPSLVHLTALKVDQALQGRLFLIRCSTNGVRLLGDVAPCPRGRALVRSVLLRRRPIVLGRRGDCEEGRQEVEVVLVEAEPQGEHAQAQAQLLCQHRRRVRAHGVQLAAEHLRAGLPRGALVGVVRRHARKRGPRAQVRHRHLPNPQRPPAGVVVAQLKHRLAQVHALQPELQARLARGGVGSLVSLSGGLGGGGALESPGGAPAAHRHRRAVGREPLLVAVVVLHRKDVFGPVGDGAYVVVANQNADVRAAAVPLRRAVVTSGAAPPPSLAF
mmetsp:Transcript_4906/g.9206  ORF Transcript_4906/g.9206 Transcript_4906/m.9206 type:complete len:408 (+) Transcript_4906:635-1858(+)